MVSAWKFCPAQKSRVPIHHSKLFVQISQDRVNWMHLSSSCWRCRQRQRASPTSFDFLSLSVIFRGNSRSECRQSLLFAFNHKHSAKKQERLLNHWLLGLFAWEQKLLQMLLIGHSKHATICLLIFDYGGEKMENHAHTLTCTHMHKKPQVQTLERLQVWMYADLEKQCYIRTKQQPSRTKRL